MNHNPPLDWWRPSVRVFAPVPDVAAASGVRERRLAFGGLLALTVMLITVPQDFVPALAPFRPALLAAVAAGLGYWLDRSHRAVGPIPKEVILAGLLFAWSVVTIPLSYWPGGSAFTLSDIFIKALVAFWLVSVIVDSVARLRTLFWTLSVLSIPLAVTGILHYMSGAFMPDAAGRIAGYGTGIAGNPNDLALTLDIIIPLTAALTLSARTPAQRWTAFAILGLDATAVVVTFSRGGFITLAVVLTLYLLWMIRRRAGLLLGTATAALVVLVAAAPAGYLDRLQTIVNIDSDPTGSAQARWADTVVAVQFVADHPIVGAGLGMDFLALNELRGATWKSVHNAYLNYAMDLGLPGLALFLALLVISTWGARRVERQLAMIGRDAELLTLAGGVRIGLLGFAVAALFYPVAYQFYFYYLAGLSVAIRRIGRSRLQKQVS